MRGLDLAEAKRLVPELLDGITCRCALVNELKDPRVLEGAHQSLDDLEPCLRSRAFFLRCSHGTIVAEPLHPSLRRGDAMEHGY